MKDFQNSHEFSVAVSALASLTGDLMRAGLHPVAVIAALGNVTGNAIGIAFRKESKVAEICDEIAPLTKGAALEAWRKAEAKNS